MKINNYIPEKYLHAIFEIGVVLKGVDGVLEIIGAGLLFFVKAETLNAWLRFLTEHELSQDPKDAIANYLVSAGHRLFSGALVFAAVYLLAHGVVKILIVGGLLKNKLWAYPLGIIVFTAFVFYQLYRYTLTHSLAMIILTVLDVIVILLTWHEYQFVKNQFKVKL